MDTTQIIPLIKDIVLTSCTLGLSVLLYRRSKNTQIAIDCLEQVYYKCFRLIEPQIYSLNPNNRNIRNQIIKEIEHYLDEHRSIYADYRIIQDVNSYIRHIDKDNETCDELYLSICEHIDKGYDKYIIAAGFKKRSIAYRLNHKQYKSKWKLVLYILSIITKDIVTGFVMLIISLIALLVLKLLFQQ